MKKRTATMLAVLIFLGCVLGAAIGQNEQISRKMRLQLCSEQKGLKEKDIRRVKAYAEGISRTFLDIEEIAWIDCDPTLGERDYEYKILIPKEFFKTKEEREALRKSRQIESTDSRGTLISVNYEAAKLFSKATGYPIAEIIAGEAIVAIVQKVAHIPKVDMHLGFFRTMEGCVSYAMPPPEKLKDARKELEAYLAKNQAERNPQQKISSVLKK